MKIQIKNRFNGSIIFETDAETIGDAVKATLAANTNLSGANLSGADLYRANLSGADLYRADLSRANLSRANLCGANLYRANLSGANLSGADLSGANLSGANLSRADLCGANLSRADLCGADLSRTNLSRTNLCGADLREIKISKEKLDSILSTRTILPEGELIVWKKLEDGVICKLRIPADAKRVGGLIGRKCRCEFADVLEGSGAAKHNGMKYEVGQRVMPDKYDPDPLVECSHGIHFFITRAEAEAYD